jgi:hypothetical protein
MKTRGQLHNEASALALRASRLIDRVPVRCPASDRLSRGLGRIARNWDKISRLWASVTVTP